jgi:thiol-disulfide isomerase/thioredoxin
MKKICAAIIISFLCIPVTAQQVPSWKIKDVVDYYSQKKDSVYVINFWATYCRPCIEEMPFLQSLTQKYAAKKVTLLLVSLDLVSFYPDKIAAFAKKHQLKAPMVWLNETDADYFCNVVDKKWSGSIPATIIVNGATGYKKFYEQEFSPAEFEAELNKALTTE